MPRSVQSSRGPGLPRRQLRQHREPRPRKLPADPGLRQTTYQLLPRVEERDAGRRDPVLLTAVSNIPLRPIQHQDRRPQGRGSRAVHPGWNAHRQGAAVRQQVLFRETTKWTEVGPGCDDRRYVPRPGAEARHPAQEARGRNLHSWNREEIQEEGAGPDRIQHVTCSHRWLQELEHRCRNHQAQGLFDHRSEYVCGDDPDVPIFCEIIGKQMS